MLFIHSLIVVTILTLTIMLPKFLGYNWTFMKVWGPTSITVLFYSVIVTSVIYYLLGLLHILTKKAHT